MENLTFYPANEIVTIENYPYGYNLRCTKKIWIEFNPKKGFRLNEVTKNPKTEKWNNPKKSVYYGLMLLYKDSKTGYIETLVKDFNNSDEKMNSTSKFIFDHFHFFTDEQIKFFAIQSLVYFRSSIQAQIVFCGSKLDDLIPLFKKSIEISTRIMKEGKNEFNLLYLDVEKINSFKNPNFNPFTIKKIN
jgi:hypothetical protein